MAELWKSEGLETERRTGERRLASDPNYPGPERRVGDRRSGKDNRRHPRYRVKDQIYVCLRSEQGEEVGRLLDISMGGLSLQYLGGGEAPKTYRELGILSGIDLAREQIPFRTVTDRPIENDFYFSTTELRRCGVEFEELTAEQRIKLRCFIRNFTAGHA